MLIGSFAFMCQSSCTFAVQHLRSTMRAQVLVSLHPISLLQLRRRHPMMLKTSLVLDSAAHAKTTELIRQFLTEVNRTGGDKVAQRK